mmetsp:Transcript_76695/g.135853  ORF Transcript_76695/g.135853 Transcript_76695/m.135853 type:complete len:111 (+) Transcript_76695:2-334(+)
MDRLPAASAMLLEVPSAGAMLLEVWERGLKHWGKMSDCHKLASASAAIGIIVLCVLWVFGVLDWLIGVQEDFLMSIASPSEREMMKKLNIKIGRSKDPEQVQKEEDKKDN